MFQDTIVVARKLGIIYVWIDSICIIQDGQDFLKEKDKMAQYYQNSIFTIAACDTHSGLLEHRLAPSFNNIAMLPYRRREDRTPSGAFYILKMPTAERMFSDGVQKSEFFSKVGVPRVVAQ